MMTRSKLPSPRRQGSSGTAAAPLSSPATRLAPTPADGSLEPARVRRLAAEGLRGGGESLPHLDAIQRSFGRHDVRGVRAFRGEGPAAAGRALRAEAYAAGGAVAFAQHRPDLGTAAHEAAHVVQQQAGVRPAGGVGRPGDRWEEHAEAVAERVVRGRPAADLLDRVAAPTGSRRSAFGPAGAAMPRAAMPVQKKDEQFAGPTDAGGVLVKVAYPGYGRKNPLNAKPLTDCAVDPWIRTAGEKKSSQHSQPGTPTDFNDYSKGKDWSRTGGLVRDKTRNQAATKMHAINHRIDNTWTQNDPNNIFLGTAASNNPNHLHKVENPVIESIGEPGDNAAYEMELTAAVETQEQSTGDDVLFWPAKLGGGINVSAQAVKHTELKLADRDPSTHKVTYNKLGAKPKKKVKKAASPDPGYALKVGAKTAKANFYHAWVKYQVTPNYPAKWTDLPQYVQDNWDHEDMNKGANATRATRLNDFKNWALNAFPEDFTAEATYYTASYDQANPYRRETDGPYQYSTDL